MVKLYEKTNFFEVQKRTLMNNPFKTIKFIKNAKQGIRETILIPCFYLFKLIFNLFDNYFFFFCE